MLARDPDQDTHLGPFFWFTLDAAGCDQSAVPGFCLFLSPSSFIHNIHPLILIPDKLHTN